MARFIFLYLILLFSPCLEATVVFENNGDGSPQPFRSPQLTAIGETLRTLTQEAMDAAGDIDYPFANQENDNGNSGEITINVFLFDIVDGTTHPTLSRDGYFFWPDQLKVDGLSTINELSNFGNVIYLDVGLIDPAFSSESTLSTTETSTTFGQKLYGNQNRMYQSYLTHLADLMSFQAVNPWRTDARVRAGFSDLDYQWLRRSLGLFLSFRATRRRGDVELTPGRLGVGKGFTISSSTQLVYNNCAAVTDFAQGICDFGVGTRLDRALHQVPFPVLRFLYHHNSFIARKRDFIDELPGLFYRDIVPPPDLGNVPAIIAAGGAGLQELIDTIETQTSKEYIADGIGFLTLLYIWEQLEAKQAGKGDEFIQELFKTEVESFVKDGVLDASKIFSGQVCDTTVGVQPVDKICSINQVLKNKIQVDNRTFERFYQDMQVALFLDQPAVTGAPLTTFEIRNIDMRSLDSIYAGLDPNLDTGTRVGVNFTRLVTDTVVPDDEPGTGGGGTGVGGGNQNPQTPVEGGAQETPIEGEGGTPAPVVVQSQFLSRPNLDLTTFSFGFVKLENKRTTSDLSFPFKDFGQKQIGPKTVTTISSRRVAVNDSVPALGNTTYKLTKAISGQGLSTAVVVFQGFNTTEVKFQKTAAAFSRSRVFRQNEFESGESPLSLRSFRQEFDDSQEYPIEYTSQRAIAKVSGVKGWNLFEPIHEVKSTAAAQAPESFQDYTKTFKTVDFTRSTGDTVVFDNRTGILKEKITGVGRGKPFKLLLWVDQVHLSPCDSLTVTTNCDLSSNQVPVLTTPVDPVVALQPEKETVSVSSLVSTSPEGSKKVRISGKFNKDLTIQNPFTETIVVSFHLPLEGRVSDFFEISNTNASLSRLQNSKSLVKFNKTVVFTRAAQRALAKAVLSIDQEITVPPNSSTTLRIANKSTTDSDLIVRVRRSSSTVQSAATVNQVETTGGGSGGCFIATAGFGSLNHPVVKVFTDFRDEYLLKSAPGRAFVQFYYKYSPPVAQWISDSEIRRLLVRACLIPAAMLVTTGTSSPLTLLFLVLILGLMTSGMLFHRFRRR